MPNRSCLLALLALFVTFPPGSARAALIGGSYEITWDQDVDKTEAETTDVRKFKNTLELKFKGFLAPLIQNEVSFKVEHEINSNAADTTRFLPTLDLGFKGTYWESKFGVKKTHENSDDPEKNPKITDSYFVEFFYLAPRKVPDLKMKYTVDKDFEEGTTDTLKRDITLSSVYGPTDWLDMKGDYQRTTSDDRLNADQDTEDEKVTGSIALRHFFSEKIKVGAEYDLEMTRGATLLDAGGADSQKEDQKHTVKTMAVFKPFRTTDIDGSYDFDLRQNMANDEHNISRNLRVAVRQTVGKPFDLNAEFRRNITEAKYTQDDNEKTEDVWTAGIRAKLSKHLDFTFKYEVEDSDDVHVDPSKSEYTGSETLNGDWTGELAPFWKASASYEKVKDLVNGAVETVDTRYTLKNTFDFKAIKLTLEPSFDVTEKDDRVLAESTETRDFRFRIAYTLFQTRTMDSKFDHTYGRKTDSGANNIQRTDTTTWNLSWTDPIPGWVVGLDATRNATDTSEDDLPPDISSSFGFNVDYRRDQLELGISYKFDKKSLDDNSETFDAKVQWTTPRWTSSLTYEFDKTFSEEIDEGYTLTLAFKYNL